MYPSVIADSMVFWGEACRIYNEPPKWSTPNKIVFDSKSTILRDFSTKSGGSGKAVFIIPPQAGHHSAIADFDAGQSLVEAALKNGAGRVFAAEYKSATFDRRNEKIDGSIVSMKRCIEAIGSEVVLIGLCQGGWQSAIYTALYPDDVSGLVLAGAPIDFHACESKIGTCASLFPMEFFEYLVMMGGGLLDGKFLLNGFKMMNPVERFYGDYVDLCANLHNEVFLQRSRKFRAWYEYTQKLPGAFYLQAVKELFKENNLVGGRLDILGRRVDLKKIVQPLVLIAGDKDEITPREQLFNIEHYVSSKKITKLTVPAGHIGLFMGGNIIKNYWPGVFQTLCR